MTDLVYRPEEIAELAQLYTTLTVVPLDFLPRTGRVGFTIGDGFRWTAYIFPIPPDWSALPRIVKEAVATWAHSHYSRAGATSKEPEPVSVEDGRLYKYI